MKTSESVAIALSLKYITTDQKGKAIPVTGRKAHRVVRRRGFHVFSRQ
jgi:hypothetical protein